MDCLRTFDTYIESYYDDDCTASYEECTKAVLFLRAMGAEERSILEVLSSSKHTNALIVCKLIQDKIIKENI